MLIHTAIWETPLYILSHVAIYNHQRVELWKHVGRNKISDNTINITQTSKCKNNILVYLEGTSALMSILIYTFIFAIQVFCFYYKHQNDAKTVKQHLHFKTLQFLYDHRKSPLAIFTVLYTLHTNNTSHLLNRDRSMKFTCWRKATKVSRHQTTILSSPTSLSTPSMSFTPFFQRLSSIKEKHTSFRERDRGLFFLIALEHLSDEISHNALSELIHVDFLLGLYLKHWGGWFCPMSNCYITNILQSLVYVQYTCIQAFNCNLLESRFCIFNSEMILKSPRLAWVDPNTSFPCERRAAGIKQITASQQLHCFMRSHRLLRPKCARKTHQHDA